MKENRDYYVYVYIDPRSFEEFYYGKGKGSRKYAHLSDEGDSEKAFIIKSIKNEGLEPIIKVIAKDLSEEEALLIEKTLIWKLGKNLTNKSSGHYAQRFRPHYTLHKNLNEFDFHTGIYLVNVGEGPHRCWEDCMKFGFLSAGQDKKYSDPIRTLRAGDIVVAYLQGFGYVGVGKVIEEAVRVNDFQIDSQPLWKLNLKIKEIYENCDNESTEFVVRIEWIRKFEKKDAKWKSKSGLFTTRLIKASLDSQNVTKEFIERNFEVRLSDLMLSD